MTRSELFLPLALLALIAHAACEPVPDPEEQEPPVEATGLDLAVGDLLEITPTDESFRFELKNAGEYLLALVSTDETQGTEYPYISRAPEVKERGSRRPPSRPPLRRPPPRPKVELGDTRIFTVHDDVRWYDIEAAAIGVSERVVLWEDLTTPSEIGEINYDRVDLIVQNIEEIVIPREEAIFGPFSDVDQDGQIAVLLSYAVNMTDAAAFVTLCDIMEIAECPSNNGEIVYMRIPEPEGRFDSAHAITETVAHELSHLIYAYHRYALAGVDFKVEGAYLTEGVAALAQDLTGYNNGNQFVWGAALNMADAYGGDESYSTQGLSVNDMFGDGGYYSDERDGVLRGGAYLFLRYLFEQAGGMEVQADGAQIDGGGMAWIRALITTPASTVDTFAQSAGRPYWDLVFDWYTAMLVSGREVNDDPVFNYRPRREDPVTGFSYGVDPFALFHSVQLTGPRVQPYYEADRYVRAGGAEYLRLRSEAGEYELWVDPASRPRLRLLRVE